MSTEPGNLFRLIYNRIYRFDGEIRNAYDGGREAVVAVMKRMASQQANLYQSIGQFEEAEQEQLNTAALLYNSCLLKYTKQKYDDEALYTMVGKIIKKVPAGPKAMALRNPNATAPPKEPSTDKVQMKEPRKKRQQKRDEDEVEDEHEHEDMPVAKKDSGKSKAKGENKKHTRSPSSEDEEEQEEQEQEEQEEQPRRKEKQHKAPAASAKQKGRKGTEEPAKKSSKAAGAKKVEVAIPARKKPKARSPTPSGDEEDGEDEGEGEDEGDEEDGPEDEGDEAGGTDDDESEGHASADEPRKGKKKKGSKSRGKKDGAGADEGKKGQKQARNFKGLGVAYDPPCDSCYLKPTFCEIPVSGNGNCIPCKIKKLSCVYHLSPKQIGLHTKKDSNCKQSLQRSKGSRSKSREESSTAKGSKVPPNGGQNNDVDGPPFIYDDINDIKESIANLALSHGPRTRELGKRIDKLEKDMAAHVGGIERAINALCKIVDSAARNNAFSELNSHNPQSPSAQPNATVPMAVFDDSFLANGQGQHPPPLKSSAGAAAGTTQGASNEPPTREGGVAKGPSGQTATENGASVGGQAETFSNAPAANDPPKLTEVASAAALQTGATNDSSTAGDKSPDINLPTSIQPGDPAAPPTTDPTDKSLVDQSYEEEVQDRTNAKRKADDESVVDDLPDGKKLRQE